MKLIFPLTFVLLLGSGLCFDWRTSWFDDGDLGLLSELIKSPLFSKYVGLFTRFYGQILMSPKGPKLIESFADLLDLITTHNFNWTATDEYLDYHGLPNVEDLVQDYIGLLTDDPEWIDSDTMKYYAETIRYLGKTDPEFKELLLSQVTPIINSPEFEHSLHLLGDPSVRDALIDLSIDMIRISSDFAIEFLQDLKGGGWNDDGNLTLENLQKLHERFASNFDFDNI